MMSFLRVQKAGFSWVGCLSLLFCLFATPARGQGNQFGAFFGGAPAQSRPIQGIPGATVQISPAFAAGLHYDHRFAHVSSLFPRVEVEFTVLPPRIVKSAAEAVPRNYSSLYVTPGLSWEFLPGARLHPWVAVGGGYTLYLQSQVLTNGQTYSIHTRNGGALDYGGGLDYRLWRSRHFSWSINLRGQVRDFVSGNPALNVPLQSGMQHNVVATAGVLVSRESIYLP